MLLLLFVFAVFVIVCPCTLFFLSSSVAGGFVLGRLCCRGLPSSLSSSLCLLSFVFVCHHHSSSSSVAICDHLLLFVVVLFVHRCLSLFICRRWLSTSFVVFVVMLHRCRCCCCRRCCRRRDRHCHRPSCSLSVLLFLVRPLPSSSLFVVIVLRVLHSCHPRHCDVVVIVVMDHRCCVSKLLLSSLAIVDVIVICDCHLWSPSVSLVLFLSTSSSLLLATRCHCRHCHHCILGSSSIVVVVVVVQVCCRRCYC